MLTRATRATLVATCLAMASGHVLAQKPVADPLADGFLNPPNAARPRVWWHWMDGNITKDGIKLDLEWLHRVGIGGVTLFDAALGGKQVVDKRLVYMTPEWQDAIRYAVQTADSLGLDVTIATSAGWSETGGPWVKPADAMKKLVWSETIVQGGAPLTAPLPHPPTVNGPFQQVALPGGSVHRARADEGDVLRRREGDRVSAAGQRVGDEAGESLDRDAGRSTARAWLTASSRRRCSFRNRRPTRSRGSDSTTRSPSPFAASRWPSPRGPAASSTRRRRRISR